MPDAADLDCEPAEPDAETQKQIEEYARLRREQREKAKPADDYKQLQAFNADKFAEIFGRK